MISGPRELQAYHLEQLAREAKKGTNMTRTMEPPAPWEQLNISEEEFNERQAKMSAVAHGANPSDAPALTEAEKTRKKRSDAGKSKPKKPEPTAQAGVLTKEQVNTILRLDGERRRLRLEANEIEEKSKAAWALFNRAETDYFNYIDSLAAK